MVQQSRARNKPDFQFAFEPLIAEATEIAYKNASQEVQGKLRRVVEVWRQRSIFSPEILDQTERGLEELDKARAGGRTNGSGGGAPRLGGSLFGSSGSVPGELQGVAKSLGDVKKVEVEVKPKVNIAGEEYAKMMDPNTQVPTPPLHAARLSQLLRNLSEAQGAVDASIKARKELLTGLEKLVESNRAKLAEEETTATDLTTKKESIEAKKKEVEDSILRGLSPSSPDMPTPTSTGNGINSKEIERPEAEEFTPPPPDVETFTPPPQDLETETGDLAPLLGDADPIDPGFTTTTGAEGIYEQPPQLTEPAPAFEPPPALPQQDPAAAANAFLNSLNVGQVRQASTEIPSAATNGSPGDPRLKRRKMSHKASDVDEDMFGVGGVDEDGVSALLGQ